MCHPSFSAWKWLAWIGLAGWLSSVCATDFQTIRFGAETGVLQPVGNLYDVFNRVPQVRLSANFPYTKHWNWRASLAYAHLTGWEETEVHHITASLGLDAEIPHCAGLQIGAGIGLFFVRADPNSAQKDSVMSTYQLGDNESEFGWTLRTQMPVWRWSWGRLFLSMDYLHAWTQPQASHLLDGGVGLEVFL
ncbi:MAG TPA: hypothetical protein VLM37_08325 [Fibrobacteraceae bacterium]|nr:hypothetical protein [Fibrobacteraceae bacterium]